MDTIASIITAPGQAAVSIIKISGDKSWPIVEKLSGKSFKHRYIEIAWINDGNDVVDQVLVLPFQAPHSYSGEDIIEIHSHGGSWVTEKILELVLDAGARLAKAGEFTERAFLNHKIDLSQAESILDIVEARTNLAGDNAIKLYRGYLGSAIKEIREELLNLLGEVVAGIDFPDEVGDYDTAKFQTTIHSTIGRIDELLAGEAQGHILREGYKVAIVGNPNAGKSTLLNTLLNKDRAIVTDIAGTTRDTIEESFNIKGIPIVLLDTAGIRESDDIVEQIGVDRSKQAIAEADLVLSLQDLSVNEINHIEVPENKSQIKIGTKLDLKPEASNNDIEISALQGTNIDQLQDLIYNKIMSNSSDSSAIKINHRQADLLRQAKASLEKCLAATTEPTDFWTIDLKAAIASLGEITGETLTEELLDNIFSRFCIGK